MCGIMKVYSLSHPITKEIRYIGVTTGRLQSRLCQHVWDSKNKLSHKSNWISNIISTTKERPLIELLEEVDNSDWEWVERYWIEQFKQWGFSLVNTKTGGTGVYTDIKGRQRSIDAHKKKLYQYELNGKFIREWNSAQDAKLSFSTKGNSITECVKGRCKTAYGFRWSYIKYDLLPNNNIKSKCDQYKVVITNKITNDINTFTSKSAASRFLNHDLFHKKFRDPNYIIEYSKI